MVGLTIEAPGGSQRRTLPDRARLLLGRAPHCDVVVEEEGVEPEHAAIERRGDRVRLVAVARGGAVLVNDASVHEADLAVGDRLVLGSTAIRVEDGARRERLRGLAGFDGGHASGDDAEDAAPIRIEGGRRRIVVEDLDDAIEELPELAAEARGLRRLLEIARRMARLEGEDAWRETVLDAALALVGGDRAALVRRGGEDVRAALVLCRGAAGEVVDAAEVALPWERLPDSAALLLEGGAGVAAALPPPHDLLVVVQSVRDTTVHSAVERDLLRALADLSAAALDRVRLRGDLVRREEELAEAGARAERLNRRLADLLERRTLELRETRAELARVDAAEGFGTRFSGIVGRGPATLEVLRKVDRVARTSVPVLFEGESGTGKELFARALHQAGDRAGEPFVAENCAALPDTLLENELFGHERGAFTGADTPAMGLFERADGGTLFLDEVGDMSAGLQTRLLRVLQEGEVRRVGGAAVKKVDVRIVTATNRNLAEMVREGRFREDLYYRLAVVKVRVPPLRERREDVPALVAHFARRFSESGLPLEVTPDALDALVRHDWPGNVRELENEMRRAAALARGPIDLEVLSPEVRECRPGVREIVRDPESHLVGRDLRSLVEEVEVRVLRAVLAREAGNITRSARELGLSRLGLRKKMQRYGLAKDGAPGEPAR